MLLKVIENITFTYVKEIKEIKEIINNKLEFIIYNLLFIILEIIW